MVFVPMHPITRLMADSVHVEHALLSPIQHATGAESLHMVSAASKLAIADAGQFSDLTS